MRVHGSRAHRPHLHVRPQETFEVKTERSYDQSLRNLEQFLISQYQAGIIPVLLVDESQNLSRDSLKLVHYLLNFETATTKLLQIVLAGQEELAAKVLRYQELASRMFPITMNAMSIGELEEMIAFRWRWSGLPRSFGSAHKTYG